MSVTAIVNGTALAPDELRADFIQLLWAYIEGSQSGLLEWPPKPVESQGTPIDATAERAFLWELIQHASSLHNCLGDDGGRPT